MRKAALAVLVVVTLVLGGNYLSATRHAFAVTGQTANNGISVWAYHAYLMNPNVLVIDVRDVDGNKSIADVMRVFFQIAEQFKDRQFSEIQLASRGTTKFLIRPQHFQTIGRTFATENPMYLLRTLPENIRRPDGRPAFETWTGGVLGVLGAQMDDLTRFARKWFLNDYTR